MSVFYNYKNENKVKMIDELKNANTPQLRVRMEKTITRKYYSKNKERISLKGMITMLKDEDCAKILNRRAFKENRKLDSILLKIECDIDIEESLNNIEYYKIAKEQNINGFVEDGMYFESNEAYNKYVEDVYGY